MVVSLFLADKKKKTQHIKKAKTNNIKIVLNSWVLHLSIAGIWPKYSRYLARKQDREAAESRKQGAVGVDPRCRVEALKHRKESRGEGRKDSLQMRSCSHLCSEAFAGLALVPRCPMCACKSSEEMFSCFIHFQIFIEA